MGADINSFAEKRNKDTGLWDKLVLPGDEPLFERNYSVFGFLADVRNYAGCEVLGELKGLPEDSSYLNSVKYEYDTFFCKAIVLVKDDILETDYCCTWYTLTELLSFDYDKVFLNHRVAIQVAHNCFDGAGYDETGSPTRYRDFLGKDYFKTLDILAAQGEPDDIRIVISFD